jgi:hypothetical protein
MHVYAYVSVAVCVSSKARADTRIDFIEVSAAIATLLVQMDDSLGHNLVAKEPKKFDSYNYSRQCLLCRRGRAHT